MAQINRVRVYMDRGDWMGIATETVYEHLFVAGPDVFTPSNRTLVFVGYSEEMRAIRGIKTNAMRLDFDVLQPGQLIKCTVSDWKSLFGEFSIPKAEPDDGFSS
jgi:hypothetical protein